MFFGTSTKFCGISRASTGLWDALVTLLDSTSLWELHRWFESLYPASGAPARHKKAPVSLLEIQASPPGAQAGLLKGPSKPQGLLSASAASAGHWEALGGSFKPLELQPS